MKTDIHLYDMIYDMIWYMIWYGIWYDMVYDMIWYMIWYDMIWYMIWYYMVYDMIWYVYDELFLQWEIFQIKFIKKIEKHFTFGNFFFPKSCRLWDNLEKCGTAIQATDDSIIWRMLFACWTTKATNTHTQNMCWFLLFRGSIG